MQLNTDKIRILIAQQRLNRQQLADKSGVSRVTISTLLCRGTCQTETAIKLSEALGVEPEVILRSANP